MRPAGQNGATPGDAGHFVGNVDISGNLSKGGGSFKIDHPLDPENKYLYHSFVESPDMKNIYDGNVVTDENGDPQTAGFSGLRSGTNVNPIVASQGLPGTTPFLIRGFGQKASNFTTEIGLIQPAAQIVPGPLAGSSWGFLRPAFAYGRRCGRDCRGD